MRPSEPISAERTPVNPPAETKLVPLTPKVEHLPGLYDPDHYGDLDRVTHRLEIAEAEVRALRIERDRLDPEQGPEHRTNWLVRKLNAAMVHLRDAEDFSRFVMPAWPTADRIRAVHEKLTEEVLRGNANKPTPAEQLARFRGEPWGRQRGR